MRSSLDHPGQLARTTIPSPRRMPGACCARPGGMPESALGQPGLQSLSWVRRRLGHPSVPTGALPVSAASSFSSSRLSVMQPHSKKCTRTNYQLERTDSARKSQAACSSWPYSEFFNSRHDVVQEQKCWFSTLHLKQSVRSDATISLPCMSKGKKMLAYHNKCDFKCRRLIITTGKSLKRLNKVHIGDICAFPALMCVYCYKRRVDIKSENS